MKKTLLSIIAVLVLSIGFAQTATNFNCNDCDGVNHDLFTELDAGKIIVICWVMPCGSCVGPSLTTSNVVESFASSNPDKVFLYLVDDYANTNCNSLKSWSNSNNLNPASVFSNQDIKMSDYGSSGMPKVVVVGDVNHAVFYNANNSVNATALQQAINTAINATTTGLVESNEPFASAQFFPNPSSAFSSLVFSLESPSDVTIVIHDFLGKIVSEMALTNLPQGVNETGINTAGLRNGMYFVKLGDGTRSKTIKISIVH